MPYLRFDHFAPKRRYFIRWRTKILMLIFGDDMAVSDWVTSNPDRPLPWNARVRMECGRPMLYINNEPKEIFILPDGTTGLLYQWLTIQDRRGEWKPPQ
jgi:hypothetical protein